MISKLRTNRKKISALLIFVCIILVCYTLFEVSSRNTKVGYVPTEPKNAKTKKEKMMKIQLDAVAAAAAPGDNQTDAEDGQESSIPPSISQLDSVAKARTVKPKNHDDIKSSAQNIASNHYYSYVTSDILQILHIPIKSRIEIHLKPQRSCHSPVFKGRISGWSLSMINFEDVIDDVVVGTYDLFHMPKSGNYHVEILLLLCEKYEEGFQSSLNLMTVCLADRTDENGLITSKNNASIAVNLFHQRLENKKVRGRWLHKSVLSDQHQLRHNINKFSSNGPLLEQPTPVFTRFQPESCRKRTNKPSRYCKQFNEDRLKPFNDYNFLWNDSGPDAELNQPGLGTLLEQHQRRLATGKKVEVCFLGASHSRVLKNNCLGNLKVHFNGTEKLANAPIGCSMMRESYPNTVGKSESWDLGKMGCTHIVLGLFQWPFSFKRLEAGWTNVNFTEWQNALTESVRFLQRESFRIKSPLQRILLRSAHACGMGWDRRSCPPRDFRTPINAEIANKILHDIADGFSKQESRNTTLVPVSFIDTSFLIDPVWDSAPDFSHYEHEMEKISQMEAKFILSEILKKY
ncbi:hypothetical protein CTEN210_18526 [Chaetoceros tenuissimus]|uniref:Uncharacterized protein n=1 Tax=Chaetoceros tenuissimus TaxID=426638 RepID=A0AAD3DFG3_9STRA|nr:hypothetical protein CTEN210_18526 [Chaetoceros tenuissimus]